MSAAQLIGSRFIPPASALIFLCLKQVILLTLLCAD